MSREVWLEQLDFMRRFFEAAFTAGLGPFDCKMLVEIPGLMGRVAAEIKQHPQYQLMDAVRKGVSYKYGAFRFFDPGMPLATLCDVPIVLEKHIIDKNTWYRERAWALEKAIPQERRIRIPVEESFSKLPKEQDLLLSEKEKVADARIVVTFLTIYALAKGQRLLPVQSVRTSDCDGGYIMVGLTAPVFGGIGLHRDPCLVPSPCVGVAAMSAA